ncbi:MAG TPA: hypothetical protein ENO00_00200 [Deltaproteobacteria bacterium]|nr:hypothetical protein [Deltaproteobacteria bacterium]
MKDMGRILIIAVSILFIIGLPVVTAVADESSENKPVKITGTVNDNFQIVTSDGTVYEVDTNELGNQLVEEVGKKVEATGIIEIVDDLKSITVLSYRLLD